MATGGSRNIFSRCCQPIGATCQRVYLILLDFDIDRGYNYLISCHVSVCSGPYPCYVVARGTFKTFYRFASSGLAGNYARHRRIIYRVGLILSRASARVKQAVHTVLCIAGTRGSRETNVSIRRVTLHPDTPCCLGRYPVAYVGDLRGRSPFHCPDVVASRYRST